MQLNYKTYGSGEPLIILHGLFGSLDNWHSIARQLSDTYQVYLVDLRNHGKSPHVPTMTYGAMASDLMDFMDQHGLPAANIAGHSMGGKAAMQLALIKPQRVTRLISIDMTPFEVKGGHEQIIKALNAFDPSTLAKRKEADQALSQYIEQYSIRQFLLKNLERREGGGYQWKMNLPVLDSCYPEILKSVSTERVYSGPTLFIKGELSNYLNSSELKRYQQLFPKAQLKTVSGSGHWVHAEVPNAFIEIITQFMSS
jgi:esterase